MREFIRTNSRAGIDDLGEPVNGGCNLGFWDGGKTKVQRVERRVGHIVDGHRADREIMPGRQVRNDFGGDVRGQVGDQLETALRMARSAS